MPRTPPPDAPPPAQPLPEFDGWDTPRFTPIPDQLFDEWLPHLSEAELKVLLYIMRRTFGFKKNADAIRLSQMVHGIVRRDGRRLDWGAGVGHSSVQRAAKSLEAKGLVERYAQAGADGGDAPTVYRLHLRGSSIVNTPVVQIEQGGLLNLTTPPQSIWTPQETPVQETEIQEGPDAYLRLAAERLQQSLGPLHAE